MRGQSVRWPIEIDGKVLEMTVNELVALDISKAPSIGKLNSRLHYMKGRYSMSEWPKRVYLAVTSPFKDIKCASKKEPNHEPFFFGIVDLNMFIFSTNKYDSNGNLSAMRKIDKEKLAISN